MDKELWNAPGLRYIVRYRLAETLSPNDNVSWIERHIDDPFMDHTNIRELPSYRKFLVQVNAINSKGPSLDKPRDVEGYSGEDGRKFSYFEQFIVCKCNGYCSTFGDS